VFFHPATRTVIFTDLVFNMATQDDVEGARLRLGDWCGWAFGPHRLIRRMISDHAAARASVKKILLWDVDGYHRHPR
jgi:hypothetical protein